MSKQEKIVCAAIQYYAWDIYQEEYREEPSCICGPNYEFIMESDEYIQRINDKKGFITNKGRFVDPKEALEISGLGNQLRFKDRKYLLPEDLY